MSIYGYDRHDGLDHCEACRYWERLDERSDTGLCLRFPPTVVVSADEDGTQDVISSYPQTQSGWWCGEFSEKAASSD